MGGLCRGPDLPQRGRLGGTFDETGIERGGGGLDRLDDRIRRISCGFDKEPALASGKLRHRLACRADQRHQPGVHPFAGDQAVRAELAVDRVEDVRDRVGGLADRAISEHQQEPVRVVTDQPHLSLEHRGQGALAADQEPFDPPAVLRQQMLEAVAGDLAAELPESRADMSEIAPSEPEQVLRRRPPGRSAARIEAAQLAVAEEHGGRLDVVRGAPVPQRA